MKIEIKRGTIEFERENNESVSDLEIANSIRLYITEREHLNDTEGDTDKHVRAVANLLLSSII